ncbi:sensor histidine kinase N-terminal domain-containing protein [Roseobacter sp.]|uniref:sensor histidine kinase n=1 Tax=Roseobacter sp. TaxID=1907202 RepID=UPI002965F425|nr:sensor histidine kinase N-terminal domain-containing protein [Roseobacter sp.]MDW3181005.1 sensor histidine kinase N-terminal domain-containing protein [Roseobacter sp.]
MSTAVAQVSIRRRLVVQLALVAALLSVVFFFALQVVADRATEATQDNILAASATSIADAVYTDAGIVRVEIPYSALSMLGTVSEDRVFYHVILDGQTLTGYDDLPVPAARGAGRDPRFGTYLYRGDTVRAVVVRRALNVADRIHRVEVVVAQTRLGLAAISSRITTTATAIGVVFFLAATALSALAAQNALSPLSRLAEAVRRRGPRDLRPVIAETPSELTPLVGGLNGFIARLRAALTRSEDLIVEAAHRVRTPLATVRTQAEMVHLQMEKPENRAALRQMIRAVDESSRSAGQLLDHAMVTLRSDQLETEEIDPADLLRDAVDRLSPTADLKDIAILLDLPQAPMRVQGDAILLQNAVRNILDNAIKYSPADTEITVRLISGPSCRLVVCDQGRGFMPEDIVRMPERFSRGSNVEDVVGSGLGLTIVRDVAEAHGGTLEIGPNPEGSGACVSLVLPCS